MVAKIVAGVLAAIAVTGAGVSVAVDDSSSCHRCPLQQLAGSGSAETPSCCQPPSEEPSLGLAACAGAATMECKTQPAAATCCIE